VTVDYENAAAQLTANNSPAPNPPNMPPANNYGGSRGSSLALTPPPHLLPAGPLLRRSPRWAAVVTVGPVGMNREAALAAPAANDKPSLRSHWYRL
jgi:hypothetical protein